MKDKNAKADLQQALSGGRNSKILRFLLGCLGGTPWVGGAFGATAAAWSESEQAKVNALVHDALQVQDERIREVDKKLVDASESQQWVAAYIKFNPNTAEPIDSSNVSSLTDNGHLDFFINFTSQLQDCFTLQYFGSGEVRLDGVIESKESVHVRFLEPCPDVVTFVFFNLKADPNAQRALPAERRKRHAAEAKR